MLSHEPDGTGAQYLPALALAGYDYAELPLAQLTALSPERLVGVLRELERSGLKCEVCNNFFPVEMRLTGDEVNERAVDEYVSRALDTAELLGAEYIVFGSGPAKRVPQGFSLQAGLAQVAALLGRIAPKAREHGIGIAIEPLRKEECNIVNSFREGCELCEAAANESVGMLVDYYHLVCERESTENIPRFGGGLLRHVHFANPEGRVFPLNETESDYAAFFAALRKTGYDGRVSCEAYTNDFAADAPRTLALMRRLANA